MNLGTFAVVIAVTRRTRTADISSYDGLVATRRARGRHGRLPRVARRNPDTRGLVRQVRDVPGDNRRRDGLGGRTRDHRPVNSVIAFFYYARPIRAMIFHPPATEDRTPFVIPQPLFAAIALTYAVVVVVGVYPQVFARVGELAF